MSTQPKGFWKNFISTFSGQGHRVHITDESYAGQYTPYIAGTMLDEEDYEFYNVKGVQINGPQSLLEGVIS